MRQYDDPVEVRRGQVAGQRGPVEGPEQFLWRGRLWKVSDVVAHWVETGKWWRSAVATAAVTGEVAPGASAHDLLAEREVWRVEASRGRVDGPGVFDLVLDGDRGGWRLARCWD